jgi:hypothetical protein
MVPQFVRISPRRMDRKQRLQAPLAKQMHANDSPTTENTGGASRSDQLPNSTSSTSAITT